MPLTNSERSRRYRDKMKSLNYDKFKHKEKNIDLYDNDVKPYVYEDSDNEEIIKEVIKEDSDKEVIKEVVIKENSDNEVIKEVVIKEDSDNEVIKEDVKKIIIKVINVNEKTGFKIYSPLDKRIKPINKSYLQPQTIKLYINSFKKIYYLYFNTELDETLETEILNNLENKHYNIELLYQRLILLQNGFYDFIEKLNKNQLQYLYSILCRIDGLDSLICQLYPYIFVNQLEYQESRDNKQMNENQIQKYKLLNFNLHEILNIINETNLTKREKLIFALFMLFPVRRPIDYVRMYIINIEPLFEENKIINDRKNYYYNGMFYFFRTKNKEIQKFKISNHLNTIILDYIENRTNGPLLLDNKNKEYDNSTIRIHIMKIFKQIYNISYTCLELRHYYSTYINELVKNKKISILEQIEISNQMNHSYEENKKYSYL